MPFISLNRDTHFNYSPYIVAISQKKRDKHYLLFPFFFGTGLPQALRSIVMKWRFNPPSPRFIGGIADSKFLTLTFYPMKEPEIFDIVVAVNRLKDAFYRLEAKVDFLAKPMSQQLNRKFLDSNDAARILKISRRTLAKMRSDGSLPFIRVRRKIIYAASDIEEYLKENHNVVNSY
jgi:excisionase family DNA binding protein